VRLAERVRHRRGPAKSDYPSLPRPLNDLLARVVGLDGILAPVVSLPFGLSIMVVARRPALLASDTGGGS